MNADCVNTVGSYSCKCRAGYTGDGQTCNGKKPTYQPTNQPTKNQTTFQIDNEFNNNGTLFSTAKLSLVFKGSEKKKLKQTTLRQWEGC